MTGEIGAAGDLATGTLFARAVEPHAGEGGGVGGGARHLDLCLNCGTALRGDFCHACGQSGHVHRTLVSIGHDLLHGVFHFEGKVWRTLPMLVARPGALTRRYIAGERARFVSPLALFLFSVFLMFAVLHSGGEGDAGPMSPAERAAAIKKLDLRIADEQRRLRANEAQQLPPPGLVASLRTQIASDTMRRNALSGGREAPLPETQTGWHTLDHGLKKANANPGLAIYKLQSSAYKYSWVLIPISVPLVAVLFLWRRRFKLYDHAIFVTYSLSFMMFLVVAMTLGGKLSAPGWLFALLLWVAPPTHMFFQLHGAYSLRKRSALWRTAVLLVFAWLALALFMAMLLVMGLLG